MRSVSVTDVRWHQCPGVSPVSLCGSLGLCRETESFRWGPCLLGLQDLLGLTGQAGVQLRLPLTESWPPVFEGSPGHGGGGCCPFSRCLSVCTPFSALSPPAPQQPGKALGLALGSLFSLSPHRESAPSIVPADFPTPPGACGFTGP